MTPTTDEHTYNPECLTRFATLEAEIRPLDQLPDIGQRIARLETWVERQNGALRDLVVGMRDQLTQITTIAAHFDSFAREAKEYRESRESRESREVATAPDAGGKLGVLERIEKRRPVGLGMILGVLWTLLAIGAAMLLMIPSSRRADIVHDLVRKDAPAASAPAPGR